MPVFEPGWHRAAELTTLLGEWVAACARYRFSAGLVSRLVAHAGAAFAPHPGLDWLEAIIEAHRSTTSEDWRSDVGRPAGELLATLWSRSTAAQRRADVVGFRSAAAVLADRGVAAATELLPEIAVVQAGG